MSKPQLESVFSIQMPLESGSIIGLMGFNDGTATICGDSKAELFTLQELKLFSAHIANLIFSVERGNECDS